MFLFSVFVSFSFVFVFFLLHERQIGPRHLNLAYKDQLVPLAHQELRVRLEHREYQDPVVLLDHQDVPVATERMETRKASVAPEMKQCTWTFDQSKDSRDNGQVHVRFTEFSSY